MTKLAVSGQPLMAASGQIPMAANNRAQAARFRSVEPGMNSRHRAVRRPHWLIRYYKAQIRLYLRVLRAVRILPSPVYPGKRG